MLEFFSSNTDANSGIVRPTLLPPPPATELVALLVAVTV